MDNKLKYQTLGISASVSPICNPRTSLICWIGRTGRLENLVDG